MLLHRSGSKIIFIPISPLQGENYLQGDADETIKLVLQGNKTILWTKLSYELDPESIFYISYFQNSVSLKLWILKSLL